MFDLLKHSVMHRWLTHQGYLVQKSALNEIQIDQIKAQLTVQPVVLKAFQAHPWSKPPKYRIYQESPNYLFLPRFYALQKLGPPLQVKFPPSEDMSSSVKFIYPLRTHQIEPYSTTMESLYNQQQGWGGGVLCLYCGAGKTALAIKMAIELGGKTMVIVNKEFLMNQWVESINKFTGSQARIGIIQQNRVDVEDKDFVIVMLHSLAMKNYPKEIFTGFRLQIVDECHHMSSEVFSRALPKVGTHYTLGLSATPERKDGLSKVFYWYLGSICYTGVRAQTISNSVLVKQIKIRGPVGNPYYQVQYLPNGTKNTSAMITQLATWSQRTQLIGKIIEILMQQNRKILVLSGRISQLKTLHQLLTEAKITKPNLSPSSSQVPITFGYYYGNQGHNKKKHQLMLDRSAQCDVLLGTYHVASEGLDVPDLDTEIMATPRTDIQQAVGRILRRVKPQIRPMVIDLVDDCGNFPTQSKKRNRYYRSANYLIHQLTYVLNTSTQDIWNQLEQWSTLANFLELSEEKNFRVSKQKKSASEAQILNNGQCLI